MCSSMLIQSRCLTKLRSVRCNHGASGRCAADLRCSRLDLTDPRPNVKRDRSIYGLQAHIHVSKPTQFHAHVQLHLIGGQAPSQLHQPSGSTTQYLSGGSALAWLDTIAKLPSTMLARTAHFKPSFNDVFIIHPLLLRPLKSILQKAIRGEHGSSAFEFSHAIDYAGLPEE